MVGAPPRALAATSARQWASMPAGVGLWLAQASASMPAPATIQLSRLRPLSVWLGRPKLALA